MAQLKPPGHTLPNEADGYNNLNTPVRYVGLDYATRRSWSIKTQPAADDNGLPCTTCHRLAVPNRDAFGFFPNGTAAHFANIATAATQDSKNPHSRASRIWMRPGQITYSEAEAIQDGVTRQEAAKKEAAARAAEATATKFHNCAVDFFNSNFKKAPPGCDIVPLGGPWGAEIEQQPIGQQSAGQNQNLTPLFHLLLK
ncbi:MAG: hypothetical protein IPN42_08955 [Methylococcaceae bacterium]|nr:hypothetical protein [Methylococcaceae bacterium]